MYCIRLGDSLEVSHIGGKAAGLARLARAGFQVPPGYSLTPDAFRSTGTGDSNRGHGSAASVDCAAREEHHRFWRDLGWKEDTQVAVRSSALVEDGTLNSHAGQFRSILNVIGPDAAFEAAKLCWTSASNDTAQAYAFARGAESGPMSILVQQMVPAELSGVAFTVEPVSGRSDVIYIEAISGLGESLVAGDSNPEARVWASSEGEILRLDWSKGSIPLTSEDFSALATLCRQVAEALRIEADIEWAWTSVAGFSIVQARPITVRSKDRRSPALPEIWELPGVPHGGWTDEQRFVFGCWDEYNARAITPLEWDLYERDFWEANVRMFDSYWRGPSVLEFALVRDGVPIAVDPAGRVVGGKEAVPSRPCMDGVEDWDSTFSDWLNESRKLRESISDVASDEMLLELIREAAGSLSRAVCRRMASMGQWIAPAAGHDPEVEAEESLRALLADQDQDPERILEDLKAGIEHDTALMNDALEDLIQSASSSDGDPFVEAKVAAFIQRFGHFQFGNRSIESNPDVIWDQVRAGRGQAGPRASRLQLSKERYRDVLDELRSRLGVNEFVRLEELAATLRYWIGIRESSKTRAELSRPILERAIAVAGRRLESLGRLRCSASIYFLRFSELEELLFRAAVDLNQAIETRRQLYEWKSRRSWLPAGFATAGRKGDGNVLQGIPVSPGKAEGNVRVIEDPSGFPRIQEGDILVTYSTNPLWTQVFSKISGIVIEKGGRTSHAAVVAREFGIPAIAGLEGACKLFSDGDRVVLDGDEGTVRRS